MIKRYFSALHSPAASLWMIGLMCLLPFVILHHHLPIPAFYGEWVAAVTGLIAMWTLFRREVWEPIRIPQIALIFPGLAAILAVQWMLGMLHSHQYALLVLSYLFWAFCLALLGGYLRHALGWARIARVMARCVVAGGLINAAITLLQYAMQNGLTIPWLPKLHGYGAIAQANHFADYIAMATASSLYLYVSGQVRIKAFGFMLVVFMAMLAFSGSRSSWLYLGALSFLAIAMQVTAMRQQTGSTQKRSLLRVGLLLLPLFALVQLVIHLLPGLLHISLVTLPTERLLAEAGNVSGVSARWQIWHESWRLFIESPWLGVGAGQMRWASFLLLDTPGAAGAAGVFEHAHNLILHLLAEMGVGAALLVIAGIAAWLRGYRWRDISIEGWWLLSLLAVLGIHSMLEYPLWYAYFLGTAAFLLGAGDEKQTSIRLPRLGRSIFAAGMLMGVVVLGTMVIANAKLETWLMRAMKGEVSAQEQPQFFEALNWVHDHAVLAPYAELMYATALVMSPDRLDDKLWVSQSSMRFMPMRKIAYRHVLLLKLKGGHPEAVRQLNRSLIAFPGKFTKELESMPFAYWQDYLDVLSEARPIPLKK